MTTEQSVYLADKLKNETIKEQIKTILKELKPIQDNFLDCSCYLEDTSLEKFINNSFFNLNLTDYKLILKNCDENNLFALDSWDRYLFLIDDFWEREIYKGCYKIFNDLIEIKINTLEPSNDFLTNLNYLIISHCDFNNFYKSYILKGMLKEYANKLKTIEIKFKVCSADWPMIYCIGRAVKNYYYNNIILNKLNNKRVHFACPSALFDNNYKLTGSILTAKQQKDLKILGEYKLNLKSIFDYNKLFEILNKAADTTLWDININKNILILKKLSYYSYKRYITFK